MLDIYKYSLEEAVACCMHRASAEISGGTQSMPLTIKSTLSQHHHDQQREGSLVDVERHKRLCFSGAAQLTNVNAGKGVGGLSLND